MEWPHLKVPLPCRQDMRMGQDAFQGLWLCQQDSGCAGVCRHWGHHHGLASKGEKPPLFELLISSWGRQALLPMDRAKEALPVVTDGYWTDSVFSTEPRSVLAWWLPARLMPLLGDQLCSGCPSLSWCESPEAATTCKRTIVQRWKHDRLNLCCIVSN